MSYLFSLFESVLQTALEDTNDPQAPSKILRQLKHERQLEQLELARKEAELRSRARGAKARRILNCVENELGESLARYVP